MSRREDDGETEPDEHQERSEREEVGETLTGRPLDVHREGADAEQRELDRARQAHWRTPIANVELEHARRRRERAEEGDEHSEKLTDEP